MARKTATITIDAPGRDNGKVFFLTEMPASQSEEWAMQVLALLAKAGVEVDDLEGQGLAGIAKAGFRALGQLPFAEARPLFQQMMDCIQIIPAANNPSVKRNLIEDDVEELTTRLRLRMEVFKLHTEFFTVAAPSS